MANLSERAANAVSDLIDYTKPLDIAALRDQASDRMHDEADSAVTYYSQALDIINRYEREAPNAADCADDSGSFKPSEWQQAMAAYAYWVAREVLEAEATAIIDEIGEAAERLEDEMAQLAPEAGVRDDIRVSAECPHGWAAHSRENKHGDCFWLSGQLDGCNAVAIRVRDVCWLSYTWDPAEDESHPDSDAEKLPAEKAGEPS